MGADGTFGRLLKGARKLGEFWREGDRCALGWDALAGACRCDPETRFCQGRVLWTELAVTAGREPAEGPYGVALMMTASEWDATGLTMRVELERLGDVAVGPKGTLRMADLAALAEAPEGAAAVLKIMGRFPGAVVDNVEKPDAQREQGDPGGEPDARP